MHILDAATHRQRNKEEKRPKDPGSQAGRHTERHIPSERETGAEIEDAHARESEVVRDICNSALQHTATHCNTLKQPCIRAVA